MFIAITLNHLRAIKAWTDAHQAQATLDLSTFMLELKARNRYYRLYPQFLAEIQGHMSHVTSFSPQSTAFIGWRPYQPLQLSLSSDKLVFKQAVKEAGLATPSYWHSAEDAQADFILKRSAGSFGYQLAGPYRKGQVPQTALPKAMTGPEARGVLFAEAFISGHNLKVWFWGDQPVHTQYQPYATVQGDGRQTVESLVCQRLEDAGKNWDSYKERDAILSSLAFQGVTLEKRLPKGQEVWLDYRYGRRFTQEATTEAQDNAWLKLSPSLQDQITQAGRWMAKAIQEEIKAPMLYAIDGVVDGDGKVWWLELNSNPICPPTAYFAMMASLFGTPAQTPPNAFVSTVHAPRTAPSRKIPPQKAKAKAKVASRPKARPSTLASVGPFRRKTVA